LEYSEWLHQCDPDPATDKTKKSRNPPTKIPHNRLQQKRKLHKDFETDNQKNKKNIHNTQTKKKRLQFPQGTLPFFLPLDSRLLSTKIPHNRLQQKRKRHKDFETRNQKNK
jgi:primosomal protein N''